MYFIIQFRSSAQCCLRFIAVGSPEWDINVGFLLNIKSTPALKVMQSNAYLVALSRNEVRLALLN